MHYLKVEIDYGSGYVDMGTTAFMSVPYALYGEDADADSTNELQSLSISGDTVFISSGNFIVLPTPTLLGCTDSNAINYNVNANTDDGSCLIPGCTDSTALSYSPLATIDDGSCVYCVYGCIDSLACNYDPLSTCDDGSCLTAYGCMDSTALNYDPSATCDDGSCANCMYGCMDTTQFNYNPLATCDDGSCIAIVLGCIDYTAFNYNPNANTDDGSCQYLGCMDSTACNYDPIATIEDSSCLFGSPGCTDSTALNYNINAICDDGSCSSAIGDTYQGGIIFYILQSGDNGFDPNTPHGLIAATSDQSTGAVWGCYGTSTGATSWGVGTGNQNTITIVNAACSSQGIAAEICVNLNLGGNTDWWLPSGEELNKMYLNIGPGNALSLGNIGGFATTYYWSSTEDSANNAWIQYFTNTGYQTSFYKTNMGKVRAIRGF